MSTVTIVNFDGSILKKSPAFIANKTVSQILETIKNNFPHQDSSQYVLAIKTPAYVKIFNSDPIPLDKYPSLIVNGLADMNSIPGFALMVFNMSEKGKMFLTANATCTNDKKIIFPQFYYGFSKHLFDDKNVSDLISDMTKHFGLQISNPKIFLNDQEVSSGDNVKKFIKDISRTIQSQKSTDPKYCPIEFKFDIEQQGIKTVNMREKVLQEMFDTESTYFRYLTVLNNFIAPEFHNKKILKESDFQLFFGPIPSMIETSAYLANELNKLKSYSSCVAQIFSKFLFDFQKTSGEYFVNYNTKIKYLTEKLDSNSEVKKICQRSPDKGKFTLQSMLIMPIQRFPRYVLLLKELSKYTPESHPDFLPLTKVNENLSHIVHEMEEGHLLRGVRDIQERLEPVKGFQSIVSIDRILVEEFTVSMKDKKKTRCTFYLFNDLILLTTGIDREVEQMRSEYSDFFFIPNMQDPLTILYFFKDEYKLIEFNSIEQAKKFYTVLNELRNKVFENNSHLTLPTIKAIEYFPPANQFIPPMIDSSCCKLYNSISIASHRQYMIFDTRHQSLTIANGIKNVHNFSKLVIVKDVPYIYGGLKKAGPFELLNNKFDEPKIKTSSTTKNPKPEVIENTKSTLIDPPKGGRIHHTCCVYDKCIVIYGGINPKNQNKLYSDVYFYNVETGEWFMSDPSIVSPDARYKHSAVVYKNLLIIHGGISSINQSVLSDTWCYDFLNGKWKLINFRNNRRIVPRFGHTAVVVNRYMFILGGSTIQMNKNNLTNNENKASETSEAEASPNNEEVNPVVLDSCVSAKGHFCLNIETGQMTSIEIEGNFLRGLSMFSAIYDEINKQIIIFGGTDPHCKASKGLPIITKLEIPQRYISETAKPPEGPVEVEKMSIVTSYLSRKISDSIILLDDAENAANGRTDAKENQDAKQHGRRKKKNNCPLTAIASNPPPSIPALKSELQNAVISIPSQNYESVEMSLLTENMSLQSSDNVNSTQNGSSLLLCSESSSSTLSTNSLLQSSDGVNIISPNNSLLLDTDSMSSNPIENSLLKNNEGEMKSNEKEENDNYQEKKIRIRNRKYNEHRGQDDQEVRASIRSPQPSRSPKQRRRSVF